MCICVSMCVHLCTFVHPHVCICVHLCVCMHLCVSTCTYMYAFMPVCMPPCVYIHVHMSVCASMCVHPSVCICVCIHTYVCVCIHVCASMGIHACIYVHICVCIHMHASVHSHVHTRVCVCVFCRRLTGQVYSPPAFLWHYAALDDITHILKQHVPAGPSRRCAAPGLQPAATHRLPELSWPEHTRGNSSLDEVIPAGTCRGNCSLLLHIAPRE